MANKIVAIGGILFLGMLGIIFVLGWMLTEVASALRHGLARIAAEISASRWDTWTIADPGAAEAAETEPDTGVEGFGEPDSEPEPDPGLRGYWRKRLEPGWRVRVQKPAERGRIPWVPEMNQFDGKWVTVARANLDSRYFLAGADGGFCTFDLDWIVDARPPEEPTDEPDEDSVPEEPAEPAADARDVPDAVPDVTELEGVELSLVRSLDGAGKTWWTRRELVERFSVMYTPGDVKVGLSRLEGLGMVEKTRLMKRQGRPHAWRLVEGVEWRAKAGGTE